MIAALFLELEGVLVETSAMRRAALESSLAESGVMLDDRTWSERCAGHSVRAAARAALVEAGGADDTEIVLATLRAERAFAAAAGKGIVLAPGARDFVIGAQPKVRLAIVTRAGRRDADLLLSLAGLEDAFACVVSLDDALAEKPDPAPYERALARLASSHPLKRSTALALEDALPGIRAARAAGVRCLAVGEMPAYRAVEAIGYLPSIEGQTPETLSALLTSGRQRS